MILPAVIFDMDGLLLDTEKVCLDCFVDTRRRFSLPDSPEVFLKCVGLRGEKPEQIIRDSLDDKTGFDEFNETWDRRIDLALACEIPRKQGALTLLRLLAQKGCALAVATSTDTQTARRHLNTAGLLKYIRYVIGGDMVAKRKPDPEIYHKAAKQLGYSAEDCVAFEDSETGTRAAIASGATTVQIPDLIWPSEELRTLGHLIAPDLLTGAIEVGLIAKQEIADCQPLQ